MQKRYLVSCAVAALALEPRTALAQNGAATTPAPVEMASQDDIVVTAQRREQRAQDVPATIQAFSGASLDRLNVRNLDDFAKYTPNITLGSNGPGQGAVFIRGLSAGFAGNQSSATVGNFPNVAIYLDEQSMQFPGRNVDIYPADLQRIEVLEGPQGTLFGGGAEAGAVRYITNKPNLHDIEGKAEGAFGGTSGGGTNTSITATLNLPVIRDKFALRFTVYNDRRGGFIENVQSNFTRSNADSANFYFGIKPNAAGICPNGLPAVGKNACAPVAPVAPVGNNTQLAGRNSNPTTYTGGRLEAAANLADGWDLLVTESLQYLDAQGNSFQFPIGSDLQPLQKLQNTVFNPTYDKDRYSNTSWTLNGKLGPLSLIYTGAYLDRKIVQQQDYTNYSRTGGASYYECAGATVAANGGFGNPGQPTTCYSGLGYWQDTVRNHEFTNEFRISTPATGRIRAIGGVFVENFKIFDVMNFNYKSIPSCTPANLAASLAGGPTCIGNVSPLSKTEPTNDPNVRSDNTAFGEDVQRGYKQFALFGSVDFDIIPNVLTVTGGTRYFRYSSFEYGTQYATTLGCQNVANGSCTAGQTPINLTRVDSGFRSRGNITWHIDPRSIAYFTFSQGFRPGAFNRATSAVAPLPVTNAAGVVVKGPAQYQRPIGYGPDSLNSYEVGLKTALFNRRLQFDISGYIQDWKNVQFGFFNPTQLGNTSFGTNGPDYRIKGVEVQMIGRPLDGLTIEASGAYNDSKQTSSPGFISNIPTSATFGKQITSVYTNGVGATPFVNPFGTIGSVTAFSPYFHGSGRARYEWLMGELKPFAQAGVNYVGFQYNEPSTYPPGDGVILPLTTTLRYRIPGYATVDASLGFSADRYRVELFGTNITNKNADTFISSGQFIRAEAPIRPRVYGVKVGMNF